MAGEEGGTERRTDWVERQFFLTLAVVILLELCCAVWLFAWGGGGAPEDAGRPSGSAGLLNDAAVGVTGRLLCWALNLGALAGALAVVAVEGWDLDGDGALTPHEALMVGVRLLAFPVHVLLRLVPAPLLGLLGVPEGAPWPSSAAVAVALGISLWGLFVVGGMVVAAGLEIALEARRGRAPRPGPRGRPPSAP